jgi:hypothetical protein
VNPPTPTPERRQILVLSDSLAFHGPGLGELSTEARLWPHVMASALTRRTGLPATSVVYGRRGWLSRDAWFALTRDPHVFSVLLPAADTVVLAVGGMDYLPSVLPAHLREGIRLLRPPAVRRQATSALGWLQPRAARWSGGRIRTLSQASTDHYLGRCVQGIRHFHPSTRVLVAVPPPHTAASYGRVATAHPAAVRACLEWAERHDVEALRFDRWVADHLGTAGMNVDGIHWGWDCHRRVGEESAAVLAAGVTGRLD